MTVSLIAPLGGHTVARGPAPIRGADCRITTTEPERLTGELRLRQGRTARRTHPAGRFRHGTVSTRFLIPRGVRGRLTLAVGVRGLSATLTRTPGRRTRLAIRQGSRVVASRHLRLRASAGQRVRVKLGLAGRTVRADAWRAGRRQPGWKLRATLRAAPHGPGRASISARLVGGHTLVRFARAKVTTTRVRGSIGVYNGMFEHDRTRQQFGRYPVAESSYYQPDQVVNVGRESARIRRGISPNITITTKGTDLIEVLGTGPRHPRFARAERWLDRYVAGLAQIASRDPDVPVYATIEHEFKHKVRTREVTGRSADPRYYGRALRRFYAKARAANPDIRVTYWIVADDSDRAIDEQAGRELTTPPDTVLFDPYASAADSTVSAITAADLGWIKRQRWYVGQEIALGEFGMPVRFGDAALASFLTGLHRGLRRQGVSWGVFFNRDRDLDTAIAGRSDGLDFPRAVAAFRASLTASARCGVRRPSPN